MVYLANVESVFIYGIVLGMNHLTVTNGFIQKIYYRNVLKKKEFECHILDLVLKTLCTHQENIVYSIALLQSQH